MSKNYVDTHKEALMPNIDTTTYLVEPGKRIDLTERDPNDTQGLDNKKDTKKRLKNSRKQI